MKKVFIIMFALGLLKPVYPLSPVLPGSLNVNVKRGDVITLGSWCPRGCGQGRKEDITWEVLKVENGKALCISQYALASGPWQKEDDNIDISEISWKTSSMRSWLNDEFFWENSDVRSWLNEEFFGNSFTDSEKESILESKVTAQVNPYLPKCSQGNDTVDHIFLFSAAEAETYLTDPKIRAAKATEYGLQQGLNTDGFHEGNSWWWLRTIGHGGDDSGDYETMRVQPDAELDEDGDDAGSEFVGVRPAVWVDLSDIDLTVSGNLEEEAAAKKKPGVRLSSETIKKLKTGDIVLFGSYEQDNDRENGPEDIRWIVIHENKSGAFMLISEAVLDYQCYHPFVENVTEKITWHDAAIRKWLNVTLISSAEIRAYMYGNSELENYVKACPTEYVLRNLDDYKDNYFGSTFWFCRTHDEEDTSLTHVDNEGKIMRADGSLGPVYKGVRPMVIVADE